MPSDCCSGERVTSTRAFMGISTRRTQIGMTLSSPCNSTCMDLFHSIMSQPPGCDNSNEVGLLMPRIAMSTGECTRTRSFFPVNAASSSYAVSLSYIIHDLTPSLFKSPSHSQRKKQTCKWNSLGGAREKRAKH